MGHQSFSFATLQNVIGSQKIQSNIDFVIDNKMNAALIYNVSQDIKEKYCQGKGKEFDTIT